MVNLTSCPVFTILLMLGALFFYSSKIALDNHLLFQNHPAFAEDSSGPRDKSWHLGSLRSKSKEVSQKKEAEQSIIDTNNVNNETNNSSQIEIKSDIVSDKISNSNRPRRGVNNCHLNFKSKCQLSNNLIKYWEEETFDCFQSPLRNVSGLIAENKERRFLAFQPDLGGWNNIRMGE